MTLLDPSPALPVPALGFGLGLRTVYYPDMVGPVESDLRSDWSKPQIDWLEAISDNYMGLGGAPLFHLMRAREQYPIALHGVSLSIGSTDPLDFDYLAKLKSLIARVEPAWVSDHICWTGVHGLNLHDLLPLPYTQETLNHVAERISRVQDYLGRQLVLENVSSYVTFSQDEMSEWDFVAELARRSDSLILLDVNNIYVSSRNHGFDPMTYLSAMPAGRIAQMHLAGHSDYGDHVIDTHDHPVCDPVFDLFVAARSMFGPVSSMIERDDQFPPFTELMTELDHMRALAS